MTEFIITVQSELQKDGSYKIERYKELVRCKDCKYWDADEHDCNIKIGWFACGPDWFCADGERRLE